jgi:pimeloyl-ACP methyl ester carboxylesterase
MGSTNPALPWPIVGLRHSFGLLDKIAPQLAAAAALELFIQPLRRRRAQTELMQRAERLKIPFREAFIQGYAWGAGPTVLLVHGWETNAETMTAFVEPLCAAGYRVVAIDGPAHGRSPGRRADLPIFSAAIQAACTALGPIAGIVAHSFGVAATLWMLNQPNALQVGRTVLISGPADIVTMIDYFINLVHLPPRSTAMLHRIFQRRYGVSAEEVSITTMAERLHTVSALVIHDRHDKRVPFSHADRINVALPQSRLLATDGLGHNRILRDAGLAAQVAGFIAG